MINELNVTVAGRPAPQGSKRLGQHGQMREQSPYLPAWRAAVKRSVYEVYQGLGVAPADLPLFRGPVAMGVTFWLSPDALVDGRIDGRPDVDKLLRGLWDALTLARVWEDDGRVIEILWTAKKQTIGGQASGADLIVRSAR